MAVRAGRHQRALLPAHGRAAFRVFAHAGAHPAHDGRAPWRSGQRQEPDGHGRPARPPLPIAEAVDDSSIVWRAVDSRTHRRTHPARAGIRVLGGRAPGLRTAGAGSLQRRVLQVESRESDAAACGARRRQRAPARSGEPDRARSFFRTRSSARASRCAWRLATSGRPRLTSDVPGTCSSGVARSSNQAASQARASASAFCDDEEKNSTGARRRSADANISVSCRHRSSPTMAMRSIDSPWAT